MVRWWLGALLALALGASPEAAAAATAPQIQATWSTAVSASAATVHAEVDPGGAPTTYRFEYITEAAAAANEAASRDPFAGASNQPSGSEPTLGAGESGIEASQQLVPLQAATGYRYRIRAVSSVGTAFGPARAFTTQESGITFSLPDSRSWELVSPVDKNGGAIQGFEGNFGGDVLQAAAQGGAVTYSSASSFGDAPQGAPPASQYISTRTSSGWALSNVTAPTLSGAYGADPDGVPYRLFSADLARGLMLNGRRCASEPCPRSYSLWEGGELSGLPEAGGLRFEGASPDLRHVVFATEMGLDEWSGAGLAALSAVPGATLAAAGAGSVSEDGSRVYFSAEGNLYLHEGNETHQVDAAVGGGGVFQAATPRGEVAYFTKSGHLYRYLASSHAATDLTPAGGVVGAAGASADGDVVYYQDAGGLKRWHAGSTDTVAAGPEAAQPSDYPPATGTARLSADGSELLFLSRESLTGYDNTDQATGQADSEVFLWSTGDGLACLSCNPTGERPLGRSTISGAPLNGSSRLPKPRTLTDGGRRVFFDSADALVPFDSDGRPDVYEWEAQGVGSCAKPDGCLYLISGGRSGEASFVDSSESGADAFFLTETSLVGQDPGSVDLYDAREGGGFAEASTPIECVGDACQPLPQEPEDPTAGTTIPGPPNPPLRYPKPKCPKGKKRVTKHGKSHCVAKRRHQKGGHR